MLLQISNTINLRTTNGSITSLKAIESFAGLNYPIFGLIIN